MVFLRWVRRAYRAQYSGHDGGVDRRPRRPTQNAWPSVQFDLGAVKFALWPLFSGFYYKTFMGPTRGAWMFYERFIRRAAGLARNFERDPIATRSTCLLRCMIIGAGPAGLSVQRCGRRGRCPVDAREQTRCWAEVCSSRNGVTRARCGAQIESRLESLPMLDLQTHDSIGNL